MANARTSDVLQEIFSDVFGVQAPAADADILGEGILDSLALVKLLFEIEQRFGIVIPLEDLDVESFRTLERVASMIDRLLAQQPTA